jgi:uncharacterized membrane protein
MALWVLTLREPVRGAIDGNPTKDRPGALKEFWTQVALIVPPFTFISAARRGARPFAMNVLLASGLAGTAWLIGRATNNFAQFAFVAAGYYAVGTWAAALRRDDPETFALTWRAPAFMGIVLAYGTICYIGYTVSYWAAPYAERTFGLSKTEMGTALGAPAALGGFLGVILGGWLADTLQKRHQAGRLWVAGIALITPVPIVLMGYSTGNVTVFLVCAFLVQMATSSALGACAAASQALVQPRMRGTATAIFLIGAALIGLAFGPFMAGYVSELSGSLATGVIANLAIVPFGLAALAVAIVRYRSAMDISGTPSLLTPA